MRGRALATVLWLAVGTAFANEVPTECAAMVQAVGVPEVKGRDERAILCRAGYLASHDADRKTPNWVVEHLTPDRFEGPGDRKKLGDPFAADPDLPQGQRAELVDYRSRLKDGRKFDRGHMAPAASMKFSEIAMTESFYLSNMAPQQGPGLNQHIWADLEALMRDWTCDRGELHVITGPVYDQAPDERLGPDEVAVPDGFFKVAYDPAVRRSVAFILPNARVDKKGKPIAEALQPYVATLREVEEKAGLRLLTGLAPRDHRRLASLRSVIWPVREGCPR